MLDPIVARVEVAYRVFLEELRDIYSQRSISAISTPTERLRVSRRDTHRTPLARIPFVDITPVKETSVRDLKRKQDENETESVLNPRRGNPLLSKKQKLEIATPITQYTTKTPVIPPPQNVVDTPKKNAVKEETVNKLGHGWNGGAAFGYNSMKRIGNFKKSKKYKVLLKIVFKCYI